MYEFILHQVPGTLTRSSMKIVTRYNQGKYYSVPGMYQVHHCIRSIYNISCIPGVTYVNIKSTSILIIMLHTLQSGCHKLNVNNQQGVYMGVKPQAKVQQCTTLPFSFASSATTHATYLKHESPPLSLGILYGRAE